jgi:hypothetical protein
VRRLMRSLMFAVFALAMLSTGGCASDGSQSGREPRDEPSRDWQQLPGFTPFSS